MNILIADGMDKTAVNKLKELGFSVEERYYNKEELAKKIKEIDILVVRSQTKVDREILENAAEGRRLKLIIRGGVGLDNIDVEYANTLGIDVRNTPTASSNAVAELVLCNLLVLARNIKIANQRFEEGIWDKKNLKGSEIRGKTLGIIGYGKIARLLAKKAELLGMKIKYTDILGYRDENENFEFTTFEDVIENADYVTIHTPLNEETKNMIDERVFKKMKKTAYFINCARGGIVVEKDLLAALRDGDIAGAALDCFEDEPLPNRKIVTHPKISVTPHIGGSTYEAQEKIGEVAVKIIREFQENLLKKEVI